MRISEERIADLPDDFVRNDPTYQILAGLAVVAAIVGLIWRLCS